MSNILEANEGTNSNQMTNKNTIFSVLVSYIYLFIFFISQNNKGIVPTI